MLLGSRAVACFIGDSSRLGPFTLGQKRPDTFGSLPVRSHSIPVECCLPLVLVLMHDADPFRCPLVRAGRTLVRLGLAPHPPPLAPQVCPALGPVVRVALQARTHCFISATRLPQVMPWGNGQLMRH
jgi:hypothetical protein